MLLVPLVSLSLSQASASQLSKSSIENLVSELALLKARVSTLEQELRNAQEKTEEDKQQLVVTMVNLRTVEEVLESVRPSADVTIPKVMFNKESNEWTAVAHVSEEIRMQPPNVIVQSLSSMMGMVISGIDEVANTWSGLSGPVSFFKHDRFEMQFYLIPKFKSGEEFHRSLFAIYKDGKLEILPKVD